LVVGPRGGRNIMGKGVNSAEVPILPGRQILVPNRIANGDCILESINFLANQNTHTHP